MAKKSKPARKANKKASKATSKKPATKARHASKASKKPALKKPALKKPAAKNTDPVKISTGSGASPAELGHLLVSRFNQGHAETKGELWSSDLISIEGLGVSQAWIGMKAVDAKNSWWMSAHKLHGASAEGPYVGATGFAVRFKMDVEELATGKRTQMEEVGVYTVENGKIVTEEFMYRA